MRYGLHGFAAQVNKGHRLDGITACRPGWPWHLALEVLSWQPRLEIVALAKASGSPKPMLWRCRRYSAPAVPRPTRALFYSAPGL